MSAPDCGSRAMAARPLLLQSLPSDWNHSCSLTVGTGIQACLLAPALAISTRVTTSKRRHAPGRGSKRTSALATLDIAAAADTAAPALRSARRSIDIEFTPY